MNGHMDNGMGCEGETPLISPPSGSLEIDESYHSTQYPMTSCSSSLQKFEPRHVDLEAPMLELMKE